jgi:hypothetical protein
LFVIRISSFVIYQGRVFKVPRNFASLAASRKFAGDLVLIFCEQFEQFWSARTPFLISREIFSLALFRLEGRFQAVKIAVFQSFTRIDPRCAPF